MKTIRPGTFETNSSSCHTITINCTRKELEEFNEGKRWYFYNWDTDNCKRSEMFASLEELYPEVAKVILSPEFEKFKISDLSYYSSGSEYGVWVHELPWENSGEEYVEKDFEKFKKYIIDNICFDMFRFTMEDDYENSKYFSKVILRSFFQKFFMKNGCPLMKIDNLDSTISHSTDYSEAYWCSEQYGWGNPTHKIEVFDSFNDKEKIQVNIDIRDN